jgi:hypothetical protein
MSRWNIPCVLVLAAFARGQDAAPVEEEPVVQDSAPAYDGSFAEGMGELRRLAEEEAFADALALSDSLLVPSGFAGWRASLERKTRGYSERVFGPIEAPLEWFGFERLDGRERAEVHYARGLVQLGTQDAVAASESLELARALAGPGDIRLDAVYNLGTLDLLAAEAARAEIPEISGAPPTPSSPSVAPGAPGIPGVPGAAAPEEPDPLELARAGYLSAREHFVERLRADWSDPDARANSELVLRRLRELDEIERQREEQQQEQQEQQDQEQQENQDGEEGEKSEEQQEQEQDQEQEQEQDSPEEEQPEEEQEDESEEQPEETDDESSEDEEQPTEQAEQQQLEEQHLTEEEMKRLLELLKEIDEDGEELRERLRGTRRVPVKKDW